MMSEEKPTLGRMTIRILRPLVIAYLVVVLLLMLFEEKLIFPAPRDTKPLQSAKHDDCEDVVFAAADGTQLHGRFYPVEDADTYILYCHGNGDMVSWLDPHARQLREELSAAIFVFDYRGYGRSTGSPDEQGVLQDARAARRELARRLSVLEEEIVLMGRSLGSAVAVDLAAEIEPPALILQNAFTRLSDVASHHYPWAPIRLLLRSKFDAVSQASLVGCPVLQSHGTEDAIIPFSLGRRLFEAFPGRKEFVPITGHGHNDPETAGYYERLKQFVSSIGSGS